MDFRLVVTREFGAHLVGEVIEDVDAVDAALRDHSEKVVRVDAPNNPVAAPAPTQED